MLGGSAWASRGDRAFASVEYPQQRPLAEWERKRARRRAELEEKTARRQAEFTALLPAIAAQVAADVSAAVAAALQATRAEPLKELNLAPTTTTTSIISESSTSIQMPGGSSSISTTGEAASASHDLDLPSAVPVTCSTDCPRRDNGSSDATATTSASAAGDVSTTCVLPHSTAAAEPEATIPAVCAKTALHKGDDDLIPMAPSKRNSATASLDFTSIPTVSSHLVSVIEPVLLTRCSMEYLGEDTTVDRPAFAPCSSILKRLGSTLLPAGIVLGFDETELVIATQLPADDSLQHFPLSRSFFVAKRGATATAVGIQFLLLYNDRPLPWPSFLDSHHVGDQLLFMPCSLLTCFGEWQKHPWQPIPMISLMGFCCSDLILTEEPSKCSQCVHLQVCCLPDQAKHTGKLFLFTENDQVDEKSLGYSIRCGSEAIQCELSCCCQPWMSWQLQFFISAPRIVSSIYDLLISLKTRYELDMRPDLSLQPDILALGCCSIVLQTMSICSALQITQFPWFLASSIQPGAPIFLGSDCYLLIALIYMQQCPVWEVCFSFPKLQYYTEFGSTTQADQNRYRTEDYMESIRGACFWFGTVGNASIYGSSHFQWYIAWSYTLAQADVRTIHLARPTISLITTEAPASDPSIATVRLFTVWTSDLIIYICVEQIEAHLSRSCDQHQKKSGASLCNCSSISSIVPAPSVSCTWNTLLLVEYSRGCSEQEGSGNLCGKCLQQVEFEPRPLPWPSFEHDQDGWQQRQSPHQLLSRLLVNFDYSLEAWVVCYIDGTWVSRFGRLTYADDSFVYGCEMTNGSHHKKPWDPGGILSRAWIFQWQVVLIHCKSRLGGMHSTLQWSPLQVNCHFAKIQIVLLTRAQMNEEINCETSLDLVVSCRNPAWTLAYTSSWRLMFTGFLLQCGPEADVLLLISPGHPVTIHCAGQGYTSSSTFLAILNERAKVQQHYIYTRVVIEAAQLLNKQSSSNHAIVWSDRTNLIDHRAIITIVWSNQLMKLKRRIDEEKGRRNAAAPAYYSGHCLDHVYYFDKACAYNDYYLDVISEHVHIGHIYYMGFFREQLHVVCYLYLAKVCLDYNTHRNLGEVMKHRALWDPGGSTGRRLEVKPKIKEGGMLATIPCYAVGWNVLCFCWAWASRKPQEASATYTRGWLPEDGAWLWNGRLRPPRFCLPHPLVLLSPL